MKINFKHVTAFSILIAITATSCTSNSDSEPEPLPDFFNLNVGNEWVYKEYRREFDNQQYTFRGKIDSVKVESVVTISGLVFSKLRHKIGNQLRYEYLRVDTLGHLVGNVYLLNEDPATADGLNHIKHPGENTAYENTIVLETGTTFSSIHPNTNILVEDNSYNVSPYVNQYTSPEGESPVIDKSVEADYQRQIGLVKKTNGYSHAQMSWEDRLVSYHIVN